jgi:non-homologous end joining protein Ku
VAPRAYWKGYLKLSPVSCPVALFPASSEREKISFHQINKKTGYEVGKGEYIEIEPEELEAIAIESKRTIEIDEFVPKKEIDELYLNSPYTSCLMAKWANRHSRSFARRSVETDFRAVFWRGPIGQWDRDRCC